MQLMGIFLYSEVGCYINKENQKGQPNPLQLMIPQVFHHTIMCLAHVIPLEGLVGADQTLG